MTRGSPRVRRGRPALSLVAVLTLFGSAACGPTAPTNPPTFAVSPSASPTASASPAAPGGSSAVGSPPSLPASVTVDPGLLEVLPAKIDGVTLEPDPATAAQVASDPLLADSALSIAVALAVGPGASDSAGSAASADLAVASVIRLRPDVFDEAFYQEWRDTYNEAACEIADGVQSEDKTEIGGRQTYTGTCVGGALTYHTYLVDQGFIVSITATGDRRFGELILAGLAK